MKYQGGRLQAQYTKKFIVFLCNSIKLENKILKTFPIKA